jgi:predicted RNA binding protein YcfA (HicA-like mRNA interferase family)
MGKWEKLIDRILRLDPNLRFEELVNAMLEIGYVMSQSGTGSSHYSFRKTGKDCVTIPKPHSSKINIVYIKLVRVAVLEYLAEEREKEKSEKNDEQKS